MKYCSIALLLLASLLLMPSAWAEGVASVSGHQRTVVSLDGNWEVAVDADGTASRATWAASLPSHEQITLPHSWEHHPLTRNCDGAVWYARKVTFPAKMEQAGALLVIENAIGMLDVYLDGVLLARYLGNGLPRRVRVYGVPNSEHRVTIRLDRHGLPDTLRQAASCSLGPISLELLPPVRMEMCNAMVEPSGQSVIVRYRLSADAPGNATLRLELSDPSAGRTLLRKSVPAELIEGAIEGEQVLALKKPLSAWTPDAPHVYRLRASLTGANHAADTCEISCGICPITQNGDAFLRVNDVPTCLKGLRLAGGIPLLYQPTLQQTLESELTLMRKAGYNAIMTDGAAPSEELLTLTDRLGILVIGDIPPGQTATGPAQDTVAPEISTCVAELGHHPSLVAWSWKSADATTVKLADLRAQDPTRPVLQRDNEHSEIFFPHQDDGKAFIDLDEMLTELGPNHWQQVLQQADADNLPLLVSGFGIAQTAQAPAASGEPTLQKKSPQPERFLATGVTTRKSEEDALQQIREVIAGVRCARRPFGYFIRPFTGETLTGLSTTTGVPTKAFTTAQAYNLPCLISLHINGNTSNAKTPGVSAALINDQHLNGSYQLYQLLVTPDGQTYVSRKELGLTDRERVLDISPHAGFSPVGPGEYRIHLQLTNGSNVLAATQATTVILEGE